MPFMDHIEKLGDCREVVVYLHRLIIALKEIQWLITNGSNSVRVTQI
jgi:hypothetical protein